MDITDNSEAPKRRVIEDATRNEKIDWTKPDAPAVPAASASLRAAPLRAVASMSVSAEGISFFATPAAYRLKHGHYMLPAPGAEFRPAALPVKDMPARLRRDHERGILHPFHAHECEVCVGASTDTAAEAAQPASTDEQQKHVMPPARGTDSTHGANPVLMAELRRWAGDEPGYAAMLVRAAVKEIEELEEVLVSRCRAQGGNTSDDTAGPAATSGAAPTCNVRLSNDEIDIVWASMPGGPSHWLKGFGYQNFAKAVEDELILKQQREGAAGIERAAAPAASGDELPKTWQERLGSDWPRLGAQLCNDAMLAEIADLRAAVFAATKPDSELRTAIRQMATALNNREWANVLTTDDDLSALDAEISELVSRLSDAATKPTALDLSAKLEEIAESWDGCEYDAPGEMMDIGASLRSAFKKLEVQSLATKPAGVPQGWQIAPKVPTDAMCVAAREKVGIGSNIADHVYRKMLAAAPAAPTAAPADQADKPIIGKSEFNERFDAALRTPAAGTEGAAS